MTILPSFTSHQSGIDDAASLALLYQQSFANQHWGTDDFLCYLARPCTICLHALHQTAQQPVGLLIYQYSEHQQCYEAEIILIATLPPWRRQGVGSFLLTHFERGRKDEGHPQDFSPWDRIFLDVAERNHGAIQFYTKHGYQRYGRRPSYYPHAQGCSQDALLMKKTFMPLV